MYSYYRTLYTFIVLLAALTLAYACGDKNSGSSNNGIPPKALANYLKATNAATSNEFGYAIALSSDGNTLAIGAPFEAGNPSSDASNDNDNTNDAGVVYVFGRTGNNSDWVQQAYLKAKNAGKGDRFGQSVSLSPDGTTLAIGAPLEDGDGSSNTSNYNDSAPEAGAVYIFNRIDGEWSQQAYLKADNTEIFDQFGWSVSLSANSTTLAVGAPFEQGTASSDASNDNDSDYADGAVYIFSHANGNWAQQEYLRAENAEKGDRFGWSVSLSANGNTLAIGADSEDGDANSTSSNYNNNADTAGAVYVFTIDENDSTWSQQAYLKAENAEKEDFFGQAVSLSADGNTLAIGATTEDGDAYSTSSNYSNNAANAGAVYVFNRVDKKWSQQAYLKAKNAKGFEHFGRAIALSSDSNFLAIGADIESGDAHSTSDNYNNNADQAGAVYIFSHANGNWTQRAYLKAENAEKGDRFGHSISLAISAESITLAVGAIGEAGDARSGSASGWYNNNAAKAGAVYAYSPQEDM